jgi:hypothetical protein
MAQQTVQGELAPRLVRGSCLFLGRLMEEGPRRGSQLQQALWCSRNRGMRRPCRHAFARAMDRTGNGRAGCAAWSRLKCEQRCAGLGNELVLWPSQAASLVGYMAWPNVTVLRDRWIEAHRREDQAVVSSLAPKLKIIQQHWARVADIVHLHHDLTQGHHQERRGGASVGKAISLIAANAKSKGTSAAKLWEIWKTYSDVAHLVPAAVLISGEAQTRHRMAPYGLKLHQFQPYPMARCCCRNSLSRSQWTSRTTG